MSANNKYLKGKIYRMVNNTDDEVYVGSTCESLSRRKSKHKYRSQQHINQKVYQHLNDIGWDSVSIILVEHFPCNSVEELKARERYWIEQLKPSLNTYMPLRNFKEWKEQNKDSCIEKDRQYYVQNMEKVKARVKEYRHKNIDKVKEYYKQTVKCECGCDVLKHYMERHKKTPKHLKLISK